MRELQDGVIAAGDPQQIGEWRILARLGAGGMGVVYLGERNGTRAAIKTIRADLEVDPTFRKRFEREAAAVRSANSDRIARILEADLDASPAYIAFEFYDGPNLRDVVKKGGALDASALQALAIGLAEGLEAIHSEGVVHRDIKPSNIIMTVRGPVIIDFGIAAYETSELTQLTTTGEPIGSPTWMSPEYITTGRAAEPGDVFGWAATVQFAATGQPPFGMGATQPLLYRITNVEPAPHGIAGPLGGLVTQALAKRPERRPSTTEILDVLLPSAAQTGSTPQLRLPLPAPITAGHRMNVGAAPTTVLPRTDTIIPPPPPPLPQPAKSRSTLAVVLTLLAILAVGGFVLLAILGLVFARSGGSSVQTAVVLEEGPFPGPTPVPLDGSYVAPTNAVPSISEQNQAMASEVQRFAVENYRDTSTMERHLQFVDAYLDKDGRPIGDPEAVANAINEQLDRFLANDVPMIVPDNLDAADAEAVLARRRSFDAIEFYPELVESALNVATGQGRASDTPAKVTVTLRVLIESLSSCPEPCLGSSDGLEGLAAASPALDALERDLNSLASAGRTELTDPDVQSAFGRFVRSASDLIAKPRIR